MNKFGISKLQRDVEQTLEDSRLRFTVKESPKLNSYFVKTKEAVLKIDIGFNWIGYDLEIPKSVLGKEIGAITDTDNYPLRGKYEGISIEIANEVINCLRGLIEGKIYIGIHSGKPFLAVPIYKKRYRVTIFGKFTASKKEMNISEVMQLNSGRPLK